MCVIMRNEKQPHLSPVDDRRMKMVSLFGITLWTNTCSSTPSPKGPTHIEYTHIRVYCSLVIIIMHWLSYVYMYM